MHLSGSCEQLCGLARRKPCHIAPGLSAGYDLVSPLQLAPRQDGLPPHEVRSSVHDQVEGAARAVLVARDRTMAPCEAQLVQQHALLVILRAQVAAQVTARTRFVYRVMAHAQRTTSRGITRECRYETPPPFAIGPGHAIGTVGCPHAVGGSTAIDYNGFCGDGMQPRCAQRSQQIGNGALSMMGKARGGRRLSQFIRIDLLELQKESRTRRASKCSMQVVLKHGQDERRGKRTCCSSHTKGNVRRAILASTLCGAGFGLFTCYPRPRRVRGHHLVIGPDAQSHILDVFAYPL